MSLNKPYKKLYCESCGTVKAIIKVDSDDRTPNFCTVCGAAYRRNLRRAKKKIEQKKIDDYDKEYNTFRDWLRSRE